MKDLLKKIDEDKLLIITSKDIYEKEALLKASYKYVNKCFINIEIHGDSFEVYFQAKDKNVNLEMVALEFGNELIDQQIRLNTGREYKLIREELVKKAFDSISK